jgi:hypothetical protein
MMIVMRMVMMMMMAMLLLMLLLLMKMTPLSLTPYSLYAADHHALGPPTSGACPPSAPTTGTYLLLPATTELRAGATGVSGR